MTKPIIVVKMPCKLLYVIQVKGFLIKCSTSWPYLISEFLVAYITIVASDWPRTFFTARLFLFSYIYTCCSTIPPELVGSWYTKSRVPSKVLSVCVPSSSVLLCLRVLPYLCSHHPSPCHLSLLCQ